jgi:hypothetical protein
MNQVIQPAATELPISGLAPNAIRRQPDTRGADKKVEECKTVISLGNRNLIEVSNFSFVKMRSKRCPDAAWRLSHEAIANSTELSF